MRVMRRYATAVALLSVVLISAAAHGQAIKQIPAGPWAIFKLNNPQAISEKLAALAQKLGVAQLLPPLNDPLGALKQQMNLKDGFNFKGEVVVAIYPPKEEGGEPRVLALVPITDYKAFLTNMQNVATEEDLSKFTPPNENEVLYGVQREGFAVVSPFKELVKQKPAGMEIPGLAGKQLQVNDFAVFVNTNVMGAQGLPMLLAQREMVMKQLDTEIQGLQPQFKPVVKAAAEQAFVFAENVLKQSQAATLGLTLNDKGLNGTIVGEFDPAASIGQTLKNVKFSDESLLAGLPNRKYFAFGGGVIDGAMAVKTFDECFAPVRKELEKLADAKTILQVVDAVKSGIAASKGTSFGYAVPTAPGQAIEQQVVITKGDSKQILAAQRKVIKETSGLIAQMVPAEQGSVAIQVTPEAKTVEGAKLDQITMQMKFGNGPEAAQAQQMMNLLYGPNGISGVIGPVNDSTMLVVMGGTDELIAEAVKSARAADNTLATSSEIKAVADQLPKNRAVVAYIALDNIITEVLKVMEQFGMKMPLKLAPNLPPIGISAGTEGSAVRFDAHLSSDLLKDLVAAGMQLMPMLQGGGNPPPPPAKQPGAL